MIGCKLLTSWESKCRFNSCLNQSCQLHFLHVVARHHVTRHRRYRLSATKCFFFKPIKCVDSSVQHCRLRTWIGGPNLGWQIKARSQIPNLPARSRAMHLFFHSINYFVQVKNLHYSIVYWTIFNPEEEILKILFWNGRFRFELTRNRTTKIDIQGVPKWSLQLWNGITHKL